MKAEVCYEAWFPGMQAGNEVCFIYCTESGWKWLRQDCNCLPLGYEWSWLKWTSSGSDMCFNYNLWTGCEWSCLYNDDLVQTTLIHNRLHPMKSGNACDYTFVIICWTMVANWGLYVCKPCMTIECQKMSKLMSLMMGERRISLGLFGIAACRWVITQLLENTAVKSMSAIDLLHPYFILLIFLCIVVQTTIPIWTNISMKDIHLCLLNNSPWKFYTFI